MNTINLHLGDCLTVLRTLPDNSIDSVVTDPPYGLSKEPDMLEVMRHWLNGDDYTHTGKGFMGKSWDSFVPGPSVWKECLRVLKPGGHLVAFFGSRTYDMGTLAVRLAGFEIRDQLMWIYGSGFPKSLNVSKAIDKAAGAEREVVGKKTGRAATPRRDFRGGALHTGAERKISLFDEITAPATDEAAKWQGWGTALKPAHEPIVLARKPLTGTVAQTVLTYGTGAINVDGCRIDLNGDYKSKANGRPSQTGLGDNYDPFKANQPDNIGRFPANVLHDGSDEVVQAFEQFGEKTSGQPVGVRKATNNVYGQLGTGIAITGYGDTGSASRFFYCAKADRSDRNEGLKKSRSRAVATNATMRQVEIADWSVRNGNHHPTVKPTDLMQWLCRLVTSPGGTVLDPFMGSGSTGKAAVKEGFSFVGVEMEKEYHDIASTRIHHAHRKYGRQLTL